MEFLDGIYYDVGNKVKVIAKIIGIIGLIGIVAGIAVELFTLFEAFYGLFLLISGGSGFLLFVSSFYIYAFGQITDDIHNTSNFDKEENAYEKTSKDYDDERKRAQNLEKLAAETKMASKDFWVCKNCNERNPSAAIQCKSCGQYK